MLASLCEVRLPSSQLWKSQQSQCPTFYVETFSAYLTSSPSFCVQAYATQMKWKLEKGKSTLRSKKWITHFFSGFHYFICVESLKAVSVLERCEKAGAVAFEGEWLCSHGFQPNPPQEVTEDIKDVSAVSDQLKLVERLTWIHLRTYDSCWCRGTNLLAELKTNIAFRWFGFIRTEC